MSREFFRFMRQALPASDGHLATVLAVSLALAAGPAAAGINKHCLNSDAAAQTRLHAYDAAALVDTGDADRMAVADELPSSAPKAARNDRTALTPFELGKERLLDWNSWPALNVTLSDRTYSFLGVHLTDKDASKGTPCIRLLFRLFAPAYKEVAGFGMLRSEYEKDNPKQIELRKAVGAAEVAVGNASDQFFVINLDRLRSSTYWQRRYETYRRNVNSSRDPKAYPVHFERFLFDVIRLSRYGPQKMPPEDRRNFISATFKALEKRDIRCAQSPDHPLCIMNSIFMETELGAAHPLKVTDALDNSGLAFGPRQLDLGQKRADATSFALRYLISESRQSEKWHIRFLQPIEQLPRRELSTLYKDVIPELNEQLSLYGDEVVNLYIDGLRQMAETDYRLNGVQFAGRTQLLAQLLAADFSNKWGEGNARGIATALKRNVIYDECGVVQAWMEQVRAKYPPGDIEDFRRRSGHVVRHFSNATKGSPQHCS